MQTLFVVLRCAVYLILVRVTYQIFLGMNEALYPQTPWFLLPACLFLALSTFWVCRRWAGWRILPKRGGAWVAAKLVGLGILICIGATMISGFAFNMVVTAFPSSPDIPAILALTVQYTLPLFGAIPEEVAFRGIFQPYLEQTRGFVAANAVTSFVFVLAHIGSAGFMQRIVFYVVLSFLSGVVASRSRSVLPAIALHFVLNLCFVIATIPGLPLHFGGLSHVSLFVVTVVTAGATAGFILLARRGNVTV